MLVSGPIPLITSPVQSNSGQGRQAVSFTYLLTQAARLLHSATHPMPSETDGGTTVLGRGLMSSLFMGICSLREGGVAGEIPESGTWRLECFIVWRSVVGRPHFIRIKRWPRQTLCMGDAGTCRLPECSRRGEPAQSEGGCREWAARDTPHQPILRPWAARRREKPGGINDFLSERQLAKTLLQKPTTQESHRGLLESSIRTVVGRPDP